MAKILFMLYDKNDPTAYYRASGISHDLSTRTGHTIDIMQWDQVVVTWALIAQYDLIMLQRPFTDVAANLILYAKDMNKPVWIDYDDNLFVLNPENKAHQVYSSPGVQEAVKSCLKNADAITVPTEYLKQCYLTYNKNIHVVPNAFNDGIFKKRELRNREKRVLWRGPDAHIYDLMTYGKEINRATKDFPDHQFLFMGYYPWFLADTENKGFVPGLDILMYFKRIFDLAPEVFHVPLHDNVFNRCRSNIGFLEGSWAGAACVVPGWWNVPGALSYNNPQEYYDAIRSLITGEVNAEAQNKIAWDYITDYLMLSRINKQRAELINFLLN